MSKAGSTLFENIRYTNKFTLQFQLTNSHVSYANTLRRMILCEVPSVGFRAEILKDGSTSDVQILKNTTAMSNEMLAHRIGLVPVHANPLGWEPNKYEFRLNVENTSDKPLDVKVSDIEVFENQDGEYVKIPNTKFFHPDPITHDTCLLAVLKPKIGNSNVESVAFKARATVGIGRENMRFSPVSQCTYSYTRDESPEKKKQIFTNWLDRHKKISIMELEQDSERKKILEREFETMEAQRCFLVNEKGEPNSFDFIIESAGVFDPFDIVVEALKAIERKCAKYAALDKGELPENIKIQPTKKEARGFDIYFQNEDHTLGNLLSTYIDEYLLDPNGLKEGTVSFCGYCVPHPLRDEMLMTVLCKEDLTCRKVLANASMSCGRMFAMWREALIKSRR
jgi:DNA-directed RNA polymerase subunit L/DNA-directed RNA polymerase alpha subunit